MTIAITRKNRRFSVVALAATLVLFVTSCRSALDDRTLRNSLELRTDFPPESIADQQVTIHYSLSNTGDQLVRGCFTFKEGYDFWGTKTVRQNVNAQTHAVCSESFILIPRGRIAWTSVVRVPEVGNGRATFTGWVRVARPESCDRYGCDEITLRGQSQIVSIADRRRR